MRRSAVTLLLFLVASCGSSSAESSNFDVSLWDPGEPVLSYWMNGGECSSPCAFRIEVSTDGGVEFLAYNNVRFSEQIDADALRGAIGSTSPDALILDRRDCGREVDGNAPTLQVADTTIDTCFNELDPSNPVVELASSLRSRIPQQVPLVNYAVLDELRAAATTDGVDTSSPLLWPDAIAPSSCQDLYAENPATSSFTTALAVEATDDYCNIWVYGQDGSPYVCPIPRSWSGEIVLNNAVFRCPGS